MAAVALHFLSRWSVVGTGYGVSFECNTQGGTWHLPAGPPASAPTAAHASLFWLLGE